MPPADTPLNWEDDTPRSTLYGDIYFSAEDGLAESRAVFLAGCGLPEAWAGRRQFTVGEIGFGTGLNICALLDLWRRERPPGGRLHILSIEAHPISAEDAARALAHWPELAEISQMLLDRWPGRARGLHRVDLPEFSATLDVIIDEAALALSQWTGKADAWFLDGFSPALNPEAWRDEVLSLVAARSAPGARASTFTVAGAVRRGLSEAGFTVERVPGHGRKRQRLEARFPGASADPPAPGRVAIIGAGIAGASVARALAAQGVETVIIDAESVGAGASGNPVALVNLRLDAGLGAPAALFARGLARARDLYRTIRGAVMFEGARQLAMTERDPRRFTAIAASDLFEPGDLDTATREGRVELLEIRSALAVRPIAILEAWTPQLLVRAVASLKPNGSGWRLLDPDGAAIFEADQVVIAAAHGASSLAPGVALQPVRGQLSWARARSATYAAGWGGYVLATGDEIYFGATFDPDDIERAARADDDTRNLASLAEIDPALAGKLKDGPIFNRASIRAATPDRLPIAGAVADLPGVFILSGLGSRGFTLAPILGEHIASLITGAPSPLSAALEALVEPARFAERARARARLSDSPASR